MNIFVLDTAPSIAAAYHCDQHLNKMILESAQLLSTTCHILLPSSDLAEISHYIYKPTHHNHPCSIWLRESRANVAWLVNLCVELEEIRFNLDRPEHASSQTVRICRDYLLNAPVWEYMQPDSFAEAMPLQYKLRPDLSVSQKYQELYKLKYKLWLDTLHPMSYNGRPLPKFLAEYKDTINHANYLSNF
jgi:hypothetical protein